MPLLKRKEWTLNPSPIDLKASDEVFIVRFTGEVFCDYDSYLTAMHKYMSKQWQCKFTGKSNLTYLEAVEEERKSAELLKEFPMEIEESCIRSVHHSIYKLEDLITFILEKQKPGKENEVASETTGIKRPSLTKRVLKRWIQEVATCTEGLWTVSPHHIQKYHLEISPSEEVQCRLHELRQKAVRTPRAAGHAGGSPGSNDAPTSPASPALELPASKKSGQEKLQVLLSLQDEEKKLRPNSAKHAAFYVLKSVGVSGATAEEIIRLSTERGLKQDWSSNGVSTLKGVLRSEITFAKVCGGPKIMYALRAMPGVVPLPEAEPKPPKGSLNLTATQGHPLPGSNPSISSVAGLQPSSTLATLNAGDTRAEALSSEAAPDLDPMAKAERTMMQCRRAVERHRETVEAKEKLHAEMKAKVATEVAALKSPSKAAGTPSSPVAVAGSVLPGSTASPSAASPSFELPSEFKSYKGPSDDRKGFLAWKKSRADMLEVLERRKEEYQLEQRRLRVKNSAGKREAEQQLQTVALQLEQAKKGLAASVLACRDAEKAVERERQRKNVREGKEREKIERDRERERIRQEMEKRRNDPLLSRKFPIDDLELLSLKRDKALSEGLSLPAPDVKLPSEPECALSTKEGRVLADLMMSADFLQQFSKQLGLPPKSQLGYGELAASITALISEGKAGCNAPTPQLTLLPTVIQKLLSALMKERHAAKEAGRQEARWEAVLSESTWLEVLRRFLLSSDDSKDMIQLVVELGKCELEDIPRETYAQLLRLLVDEAMGCESVREVLASRIEEATEVVTTMRSDIAENKKRIREIEEEVREVKKKKREEELAASQAKVAKMSGSGSEGTGDKKILNAAATSSNAEEEPSFELPEHLKSWKGDAQDRKGMLEWRQQQQKARAKFDKEKARWEAERRAREKAKEAEMKAEAEEERKREKERRSLEESIQSKQEALEKALERLALRRSPLGSDRHGRQYWWSVGGYCSGLLVLDSQEDQWKLLDQEDQIKMLMDSLDLQGIRECELHKALTHAMPALLSVVKRVSTAGPPLPDGGKAAGEGEVAGDEAAGSGKGSGTGSSGSRMKEKAPKGLPPERVQPSRRGKPVDLTEGSAAAAAVSAAAKIPAAATGAGKKRGRGEAQEEEKEEIIQADLLGPAQQGLKYQSLQHAFQHLCKLAGMAAAAKAPGPTGGWRSWRNKVQKQQEGEIDQAWAAGVVVEEERYGGMEQLRSDDATAAAVSEEKLQFRKDLLLCGARLLELEELLCEVTGDTEVQAKLMEKEETAGGKEGADGSDENGEGDKVVGEDEEVVMQEEEGEGQDKAAANEAIAQGSRHHHHHRPGMAAAAQSMGVVVADVEEGVDSDSDEPEVGHSKTLQLIWRSRVERSSWRVCVKAAVTAPRMAYCAAVLTYVSEGPLEAYMSRNKANRKK